MENISIVIPVWVENDIDKEALDNAIASARRIRREGDEIILVGTREQTEKYSSDKNLKVLVNEGPTDFCSQVNLAADNCSNRYFSILEEDDEFNDNWFDNFERYREDKEDVSIFLPLNEISEFNSENPEFIYGNEPCWASSSVDDIGYLDSTAMSGYRVCFNFTGAIISVDKFKEVGGLKASMRKEYWYEFALRALSKDCKGFVVPKVGYFHHQGRPGSIDTREITEDEAQFWVTTAENEFLFKKDRNKAYDE